MTTDDPPADLKRFWDVVGTLLDPDLSRPSIKLTAQGCNDQRFLFGGRPGREGTGAADLARRLGLPEPALPLVSDAAGAFLGGIDLGHGAPRHKVYLETQGGGDRGREEGDVVHRALKWSPDSRDVEVATYTWVPVIRFRALVEEVFGGLPTVGAALIDADVANDALLHVSADQGLLAVTSPAGRRSFDLLLGGPALDVGALLHVLAPAFDAAGIGGTAVQPRVCGRAAVRLAGGIDVGGAPFFTLYH